MKKRKRLNLEIRNKLVKNNRGAISVFVLVGLLFITAFLIILYAYNINKSKSIDEQFDIISNIYFPKNNEETIYTEVYTDLRNKNKQTLNATTEDTENTAFLELNNAYEADAINYRIYGNSIQQGNPTFENPIPVNSVGENGNITLINRGKNYISHKEQWETSGAIVNQTFDNGVWTFKNTDTINGTDLYYYITLKPGTYTYSVKGLKAFQITIYDNTNSNILTSFYSDSEESASFTLYEEKEIKIHGGYVNAGSTLVMNNVQLELGEKETQYKPYEESIVNIQLEQPLRKVGNYVDYIDYKTGKIIRTVGKIDSYNGETMLSSWISTTGGLDIGATVYYGLDTPQEENIEFQKLKTFEEYNRIEFLSSIKPLKMEIEYMGYKID